MARRGAGRDKGRGGARHRRRKRSVRSRAAAVAVVCARATPQARESNRTGDARYRCCRHAFAATRSRTLSSDSKARKQPHANAAVAAISVAHEASEREKKQRHHTNETATSAASPLRLARRPTRAQRLATINARAILGVYRSPATVPRALYRSIPCPVLLQARHRSIIVDFWFFSSILISLILCGICSLARLCVARWLAGDAMTDRWQFSTEGLKANFCPDCGSLLELPPAIGNVRCTLCPYTCNPEGITCSLAPARWLALAHHRWPLRVELETKVVVSRMSMRAHNDRKRKGVAKTEEKRATVCASRRSLVCST